MKRVLLAAGSAAFLIACGGETTPTAETDFCARTRPAVDAFLAEARALGPEPGDERYGGTAVIGSSVELTAGMNAAVTTDYVGSQVQQFVNLMTLVRYDEQLRPQPYLARSWEVNRDTTELTFRLRGDVLWHDGERTDAHDVAFTYALVTDPATGFANPGYFDLYGKGGEGMRVVDDSTVAISLRPHADFLDPWRALPVLPEHLLGSTPPAEVGAHPFGQRCPVGNGPFVFVEHDPQERWVFEANPAFPWELGGRPFLDRLVQRVVPEQTTLLAELLTGGIDVLVGASPDQAEEILDGGAELRRFSHRDVVFVAWNGRRPQLADPRVRRALTMATDREGIVAAKLLGYGRVANTTVPPFHRAFDLGGAEELSFDPAAARALLEEAGWSDRDGDGVRENAAGLPLSITIKVNTGNRLRQDIAQILQAQLADVGVAAQPLVLEPATLGAQIFDPERRDFDGIVFGWVVDFRLDDRDLFHSERIDGPWAMAGTANPRMDAVLDSLQVVVDPTRARPLWREYARLQVEEHPFTFLFFPERLAGVAPRLRGVTMDVRGEWAGVRDWWIDPARR